MAAARQRAEYEATLRAYRDAKSTYEREKARDARDAARSRARAPPPATAPPCGRIFLLSQPGPCSFKLCEQGRTLALTLGEPHRCDCGSAEPCCAHVRWVLGRVLRLSGADLRSRGLSADRIARALEARGSTSAAARRAAPPAARAPRGPPIDAGTAAWLLQLSGEDAHLLTQPSLAPRPSSGGGGVARRPLEDDECCPVCFEPMDEAEAARPGVLLWCRGSCGRSLHGACLRVWARHQCHAEDAALTCPMCRAPWGELGPKPEEMEAQAHTAARQRRLGDEYSSVLRRQAAAESDWRERRPDEAEAAVVAVGGRAAASGPALEQQRALAAIEARMSKALGGRGR